MLGRLAKRWPRFAPLRRPKREPPMPEAKDKGSVGLGGYGGYGGYGAFAVDSDENVFSETQGDGPFVGGKNEEEEEEIEKEVGQWVQGRDTWARAWVRNAVRTVLVLLTAQLSVAVPHFALLSGGVTSFCQPPAFCRFFAFPFFSRKYS